MCDLQRREFLAGTVSLFAGPLFAADDTKRKRWLIGHHFWNWDRAWDKGEFLDKRLELTKQTGYEGFEAKPDHVISKLAEGHLMADMIMINATLDIVLGEIDR